MVYITPAISMLSRGLFHHRPAPGLFLALWRLKHRRGLVTSLLLGELVFAVMGQAWASSERVEIRYPVPSRFHPVVLTGSALPALVGAPTSRIAIYVYRDGELKPILHQLDRRDTDGNFQFTDAADQANEASYKFDANDECVFMASDAGEKQARLPDDLGVVSVTEIEIVDATAAQSYWAYAVVLAVPSATRANPAYVVYDTANDAVTSDVYRATFSKEQPFLTTGLSLRDPVADRWGPNLVDTMKVRHAGKLFGKFDFVRTQADYRSKLVAVKAGPVRVIRRTANRVRVLGFLRTPSIYIDYLCYRQGLTYDVLVDVPFRIGWFFSDMTTRMTMDWRNSPYFPKTKIYSRSFTDGLTIDGKMSEKKQQFNRSEDTEFVMANAHETMLVRLDYGPDLPITKHVYLYDDHDQPDPPEIVPGQFGNVGFLTTGWELMDTKLHHMALSVTMIPRLTVQEGLKIVTYVPSGLTSADAAVLPKH